MYRHRHSSFVFERERCLSATDCGASPTRVAREIGGTDCGPAPAPGAAGAALRAPLSEPSRGPSRGARGTMDAVSKPLFYCPILLLCLEHMNSTCAYGQPSGSLLRIRVRTCLLLFPLSVLYFGSCCMRGRFPVRFVLSVSCRPLSVELE